MRQLNVKLKRMQKNPEFSKSQIMEMRLFLVGLVKALKYFREMSPPDGGPAIAFRVFESKYWTEIAQRDKRLSKIYKRERYTNLSRLFTALEKLNKNLTEETESVFYILMTVFLIEVYSLLMLMATSILASDMLDTGSVKKLMGMMTRFHIQKKMRTPLDFYEAVMDDALDEDIKNDIETALKNLRQTGKHLKVLIRYNQKLV